MSSESLNDGSKVGVVAGTLLAILGNLPVEDIWSTIILAALGAVVSFMATLACKVVLQWVRAFLNKKRS